MNHTPFPAQAPADRLNAAHLDEILKRLGFDTDLINEWQQACWPANPADAMYDAPVGYARHIDNRITELLEEASDQTLLDPVFTAELLMLVTERVALLSTFVNLVMVPR